MADNPKSQPIVDCKTEYYYNEQKQEVQCTLHVVRYTDTPGGKLARSTADMNFTMSVYNGLRNSVLIVRHACEPWFPRDERRPIGLYSLHQDQMAPRYLLMHFMSEFVQTVEDTQREFLRDCLGMFMIPDHYSTELHPV